MHIYVVCRPPPLFAYAASSDWLLNERAMLWGEVARRERDIRALLAERSEMRRRIQAQDTTMAMFAPRLDLGAGGIVQAIRGKYERHGIHDS